MPSFLPQESIIPEEKTIAVPITAFDDTALLLAAYISMSNASASSIALHLAFAALHRPRPLAVCLAPLRSHDHDEICN